MKLGDFQVDPVIDRRFKLDGGSMFGVIPKVIWNRLMPADENNLVELVARVFLVRTGREVILIDAGIGDCLSDREKKIFGVSEPSQLIENLQKLGVRAEDVTHVILTHLHADHALGTIRSDSDGGMVPTFPNAGHYASKQEWEDCRHPNERSAATYRGDKLKVLADYNLLHSLESDGTVVPGVAVFTTGGHTAGHIGVMVESGNEVIVFPSDILPTTANMHPAYGASVDLFPLEVINAKKQLVQRAIDNGWYIGFDHDPNVAIAKLKRGESPKAVVEVEKVL